MSFAVCVTLDLHPGHRDRFLPHMLENARTSLADEPGCHVFDVCTDPDRPDRVFLYELYADAAAFAAHQHMPHYMRFNDTAEEMVAAKTVTTYAQVHR